MSRCPGVQMAPGISCKRLLALALAACAALTCVSAVHVRTAKLDPKRAERLKQYFSRSDAAEPQSTSSSGRRLQDTLVNPQSEVITELTSSLEAGEDGVGLSRRPLRVSYDVTTFLDPAIPEVAEKLEYVGDTLLPALGSLLARSLRVRNPSGSFDVSQYENILLGGNLPDYQSLGLDTDVIMLAYVLDTSVSDKLCDTGTVAAAQPYLFERGTGRTVVGLMLICSLFGRVDADLMVLAHEISHALVFHPALINNFPAYAPDGPLAGQSPVVQEAGGKTYISTPQVVREVRQRFACDNLPGALSEDGNSTEGITTGTAGIGHFEQSAFYKDFLQGQVGSSLHSFDLGRMTDLTLALYQDSGWYDVKYGSAGFSTHGYHAGCAYGRANGARVLADPATNRWLCEPDITSTCDVTDCINPFLGVNDESEESYHRCLDRKPAACNRCLEDYSGSGTCRQSRLDNGFVFPKPVPDFFQVLGEFNRSTRQDQYSKDCTLTPFSRCVEPLGDGEQDSPECHDMSCTADKQLLIDGEPCDSSVYNCPDEKFLCDDPGTLTCKGDLNDCNAHGDCYRGFCYCYLGWGGDACDVQVCKSNCTATGDSCPPSGFCGVEECGEWSEGQFNRGTPCNFFGTELGAEIANAPSSATSTAGAGGIPSTSGASSSSSSSGTGTSVATEASRAVASTASLAVLLSTIAAILLGACWAL